MTWSGCQENNITPDRRRQRQNCLHVKRRRVRDLKRGTFKIIRQFVYSRTEAHAPYFSEHQSVSVRLLKGWCHVTYGKVLPTAVCGHAKQLPVSVCLQSSHRCVWAGQHRKESIQFLVKEKTGMKMATVQLPADYRQICLSSHDNIIWCCALIFSSRCCL